MNHWFIKLGLITLLLFSAPFAVLFFIPKNQASTPAVGDNNYYRLPKTELTAYEQEVSNLYQTYWHRPPWQDELKFHVQHQTPTIRLANWLQQQPDVFQHCSWPKGLTFKQVQSAYNLFTDYTSKPIACEDLISVSYQQPTKTQFISWLTYQAPGYLQVEQQPTGNVSLVASSAASSALSFSLCTLSFNHSFNLNNLTYSDAALASFILPRLPGFSPATLKPPMV